MRLIAMAGAFLPMTGVTLPGVDSPGTYAPLASYRIPSMSQRANENGPEFNCKQPRTIIAKPRWIIVEWVSSSRSCQIAMRRCWASHKDLRSITERYWLKAFLDSDPIQAIQYQTGRFRSSPNSADTSNPFRRAASRSGNAVRPACHS